MERIAVLSWGEHGDQSRIENGNYIAFLQLYQSFLKRNAMWRDKVYPARIWLI